MPKYKINSPIKVGEKVKRDGEVEMSAKDAASAVSRGELELITEAKPSKSDGGKGDGSKGDGKPDDSAKPAK